MMRFLALASLLGACTTPSFAGLVGGGPTVAVGDGLATESGVELHAVEGVGDVGVHLSYRRAAPTQELAAGLSWFQVGALTRKLIGPKAFVRLGINLLEWDRVGMDDGAGFGGPSIEIGVGQLVCVSALASRDLRFNDRDDTFVGVNVSVCGLAEKKRW